MNEPDCPLDGVVRVGPDTWALTKDRRYDTAYGPVVVPAPYTTDLASIPRSLWWLLSPWGKYDNAAILHDYLYGTGQFPRSVADQCLYDQMRKDGVAFATRWVVYGAVRVFGWRYYRDD